jgi:galactokinase
VSAPAERSTALLQALSDLSGEPVSGTQVRLVRAPGRVNLIGEHTDYNLGYVMPAAISLDTWIASRPRDDSTVRVASLQAAAQTFEFDLGSIGPRREEWIDYVAGVAQALMEEGIELRGVDAVVDSTIPAGAGLSSSAALELAAAWTLSVTVPPPMPSMALARAAQRAENEYVGVQCGLMDQFASSHGRAAHALLLDCRTFDHHAIQLPPDTTLVALDTRTAHRLGASEYNARRAQCERGAAALATRHPGVESLRDVTPGMLRDAFDLLDEETLRRCRHVVEENDRVLAAANALANGQLEMLGLLFAESHASLRDLYEVSSPELDALVEIAAGVPGVLGARMTGAGFGGCTVNLVRSDAVDALRQAVEAEYPRRFGREAGVFVVDAVDGAGEVR